MNQIYRPRRLRRSENIRGLVRETCLRAEEFIYPMFVMEGQGVREPIDSMPGQHRFSVDELVRECEGLAPLGIGFGINHIGHCLSPGQIDLPCKKGALGEFARLRHP